MKIIKLLPIVCVLFVSCNTSIRVDCDDSHDCLVKGLECHQERDFPMAIAYYDKTIDFGRSVDQVAALDRKAIIQKMVGNYKGATATWEKAIEAAKKFPNPSLNTLRLELACGYFSSGDMGQAVKQFDAVCSSAPDGQKACEWAQTIREGGDKANVCN